MHRLRSLQSLRLTHLSALLLLVAMLGCNRTFGPAITIPAEAQVAEFSSKAGITFPPSAKPLGWKELRGMDDALWLQVKLPASDLQAFLDGSPFRSATLATNDQFGIAHFQSFFATPPVRYRSGQQALPNARYLNILVDESDAANVVVYLMWHET